MQNTTSRITLQNVKNFHKVHKVKIKKKKSLTLDAKLSFWKCCCISLQIKILYTLKQS